MVDWPWYITIAAVEQWMALTGRSGPLEEDNPAFAAAQDELGDLSLTAQLSDAPPGRNGAVTYRGKVTLGGKRRRVELTVMPRPREEGALPQMIRVRLK